MGRNRFHHGDTGSTGGGKLEEGRGKKEEETYGLGSGWVGRPRHYGEIDHEGHEEHEGERVKRNRNRKRGS